MAKVFWVHPESDSGGMSEGMEVGTSFCEIVTMRSYVRYLRAGYEMGWQPPEWILDIFPPS